MPGSNAWPFLYIYTRYMNKFWFSKGFKPVTLEGWAVVIVALGISAWFFRAVDMHSHSGSDTLIGAFPFVAPVLIVAYLIAQAKSPR